MSVLNIQHGCAEQSAIRFELVARGGRVQTTGVESAGQSDKHLQNRRLYRNYHCTEKRAIGLPNIALNAGCASNSLRRY